MNACVWGVALVSFRRAQSRVLRRDACDMTASATHCYVCVCVAGSNWRSALVRTGLYTGSGNDVANPAHIVTDNVLEAVQAIIEEQAYIVK